MPRATPLTAILSAAILVTGCGATARQTAASFPSTFVAASTKGITVYSSTTGKLVRRLTHNSPDSDPMVTANEKWVYFVRTPARFGCSVGLWRMPLGGGRASRVAPAGYPSGPVAISPDGHELAYTVGPSGPCNSKSGATAVMLVNLRTGLHHRINGEVEGLAWSPRGNALAAVTPVGLAAIDRVRVLWDPFRATSLNASRSLPCPTADACAEDSPSFDARGQLFFVAQISTRTDDYCWLGTCLTWSYAIVSSEGGTSHVLAAEAIDRSAVATTGAISASGRAAIYTLPQANGYLRVWRWVAGTANRIARPGALSSQPDWQ